MRPPSGARLLAAVLSILCFAYGPVEAQTVGPAYPTPPSIAYGELYRDVELASIFPDSKTFPDMIPDATPSKILDEYRAAKVSPGFDLATFVQKHFTGPTPSGPTVNPAPLGQRLLDYVMSLWPILQQTATSVPPYSTLQPLPYPYVVPGGRFREVYYWDSYFTMLGLEDDGQHQLALDFLNDFAFELNQFGKVPNGNRSYYLSRSQPPFFSLMVRLIGSADGNGAEVGYLPQLQQEWDFWTEGADKLRRPVKRAAIRCGCRTAPCSIAIGTPAMRRATSPTRRMWRRRWVLAGRRHSSTAICVPRRNPGGISARGG